MLLKKLSPTALHLVIALTVLCTIGLFAIEIFYGRSASSKQAAANSFSYSALGHRGLVELLGTLDIRTRVNQRDLASSSDTTNLIVAEPHLHLLGERVVETIQASESVLFVLPKWVGKQSLDKTDNVSSVTLLSKKYVGEVVDKLTNGFVVVRTEGEPPSWQLNGFDTQPTIKDAQLLRHVNATPLISSTDGSLLMRMEINGNSILILSDPDLLNNHGLSKGSNADLVVSIVTKNLGVSSVPVLFDETLHGFRLEPNFWRAMLAMPFVVASLAAFITVIMLIWSASNRFGAPFRSTKDVAVGKRRLIENSVRLILRGQRGKEILGRYFHNVVRQVEETLHVPDHLNGQDRINHLDGIASARGLEVTLTVLSKEKDLLLNSSTVSDRGSLRLARQISRWKQGMLHDA